MYPVSPTLFHSFQVSDSGVTEKDFSYQWAQISPGSSFPAKQGGKVIVFSPGRLNLNDGPDFLDAVFSYEGHIYRGDVELHLHESGWVNHGHSHQTRFGGVLLHVVETFSSKMNSPLLTIQFPLSMTQKFSCRLPKRKFSSAQLNTLIHLGIKKWSRRVDQFRNNQDILNSFFLVESLACFGSGENRNLFRVLGHELIPFLNETQDIWNDKFMTMGLQQAWYHKGVRPTAYPEKRLVKLSNLSYDLFRLGPNELSTSLETTFLKFGFGKGTWVEWLGHVNLPAYASQNINKINPTLNKWLNLKLPTPYNALFRTFHQQIHRKHLCSFPVSQGLLVLKKSYCEPNLCSKCPLIETNS